MIMINRMIINNELWIMNNAINITIQYVLD